MPPSTIAYPLALRLLDETGDDKRFIQAELRYTTGDPLAVTAVFDTDAEPVPWVFARDLLSHGLDQSCGHGDIRIWPAMDIHGTPTVRIGLHSPEGGAVLEAPASAIEDFLVQTWRLVPTGTEGLLLGIDALLDSLLDRFSS